MEGQVNIKNQLCKLKVPCNLFVRLRFFRLCICFIFGFILHVTTKEVMSECLIISLELCLRKI